MPSPLPARTTTQALPLLPGQPLQLWLPAGTQLLCHAAELRVTEPAQWQLDRLVSRQTRLADGERLVLSQAGWIGVLSPQGGELLCLRPVGRPGWASVTALLRRLQQSRPRLGWGPGR
ncbi:hypothetical protein HBDW_16120 [Herbaspirillum sp. DW155]|uniref:hypothetical protein n=1 Tax=Herbaspirillum sp. DW155 TaxID=3095609 RepID=UPI003093B4D8|nr:hypothetical protein HBDW_16120 [Herbaspirillum sp. DW155]